jgi:predicted nucleotidyltransferase
VTKKVIGIIAEYNTFHHGHKLQLELAKNYFSADYIIIIMSGDFTQRGTPAIIDKYQRAQMAVYYGADLVIELPVCFATADLPEFALGGVSILNQLGVVDHILFGSECGDISSLQAIAEVMCTDSYKAAYCELMRAGYTSPEARAKAVKG